MFRYLTPTILLVVLAVPTGFSLSSGAAATRTPSSVWAQSCKKLTSEEVELFKAMTQTDHIIGDAMASLSEIALLTGEDKLFGPKMFSFDSYLSPERGIEWTLLEGFSKIVLGNCMVARDGEAVNVNLTPDKHAKKFRLMKKLCGPSDDKLKPAKRRHPNNTREWVIFDEGPQPSLRREISKLRNLIDEQTHQPVAPGKAADACLASTPPSNIEDTIEDLFTCLNAFHLNLFEYDFNAQKYTVDYWGKGVPKTLSTELKECVQGYIEKKVAADTDGKPTELKPKPRPKPKEPPKEKKPEDDKKSPPPSPNPVENSDSQIAPKTPPTQKIKSNVLSSVEQAGHSGARNGKPGGKGSDDYKPPQRCLPGDPDDGGACKSDACVAQLAWSSQQQGGVRLPSTLTSAQVLEDYEREKGPYTVAISKHQASLLAQGYVVAAYERNWESPKEYNDNLRDFAKSCADPEVRTSLDKLMEPELFDATVTDGAWDTRFAEQREMAENKGKMMVASIDRILALRKFVELLNYDVGAKEVKTFKAPHWIGYVPVGKMSLAGVFDIPYVSDLEIPIPLLHYFAGADMAISFGNVGQYQCNLFSTMAGNDFVPGTSDLITKADKAIHELFANDDFRKTAFCSDSGKCSYPGSFQYYLERTKPEAFLKGDALKAELFAARAHAFTHPADSSAAKNLESLENRYSATHIKLRNWCGMRYEAAQEIMGLEKQIVTLYPALAHAELIKGKRGKPDKPGKPLFDRLQALDTTDAKVKFAQAEADNVLPGIQSDLKKYLKRICDDNVKRTAESAFMAALNRSFLEGFDYCASNPGKSYYGLDCNTRSQYLGCKFQKDADEWRQIKELPKFLFDVGMAGLDALFVYSAASGGLRGMFTPRGLVTGGLTGVGFTGATYGISYLIARYNDQTWDDYNRGSAAAVLEGLDSYTNALTALSAAQPKARLQDFITGFMLGALLGGKKAEKPGSGKSGVGGGGEPAVRRQLNEAEASELARKFVEAAEADKAGGVKFTPEKIEAVKNFLAEKAAQDPALAETLLGNLGRKLDSLTEAAYRMLFEGEKGKLAGARLRRVMSIRIKRAAARIARGLDEVKSEVALKKLREEKVSVDEAMLEKTGLQNADLAALADTLGPRELSLLAEAAEEAAAARTGPKTGTNKIAEFVRKLCGLAVWCPSLQGLKGCAL